MHPPSTALAVLSKAASLPDPSRRIRTLSVAALASQRMVAVVEVVV